MIPSDRAEDTWTGPNPPEAEKLDWPLNSIEPLRSEIGPERGHGDRQRPDRGDQRDPHDSSVQPRLRS